jgi:hypothetical protein
MKVQVVWLNSSQANLNKDQRQQKRNPNNWGREREREGEREGEREAQMHIHAHTTCKSDGTPSGTSILVDKYFTYQKERSNKKGALSLSVPLCASECLSVSLCVDLSVCVCV